MSLATTLLKSLGENAFDESYAQNIGEPHIVINASREVIVPEELRIIAVKSDKDIETVTFDCVRYWDDNDLSTFAIYLNYVLPDGEPGTYIPDDIVANEGEDVFHFDWKIKDNITRKSGKISFAITAIKTKLQDGEYVEEKRWSSLLNNDCSIAAGLDISSSTSDEEDASLIAQISALLEKIQGFDIVQTSGQSTTAVMSQKATTDLFSSVKVSFSPSIANEFKLRYKFYYYSDLYDALVDLSYGSTANGLTQEVENAVCAIYRDEVKDRNVLFLLEDVTVPSEEVVFNNPLEINFAGKTLTFDSCGNSWTFNEDVYLNGTYGGGVEAIVSVNDAVHPLYFQGTGSLVVDGGLYIMYGGESHTTSSACLLYTKTTMASATIKNAVFDVNYQGTARCYAVVCNAQKNHVENVIISVNGVEGTVADCLYGMQISSAGGANATVCNCDIRVQARTIGSRAQGVFMNKQAVATFKDNTIIADAGNNGTSNGGFAVALQISDECGEVFISGGHYAGTHSGINAAAVVVVDGGKFVSCSHGGIYFAHPNKTSYIKNAILGIEYEGIFDIDAMENPIPFAPFYIGGSTGYENISVHMDNCTLLASDDTAWSGGVVRGTSGEKNCKLYISNTIIPEGRGGKKLRIDNGNYAYVGTGTNITTDIIVAGSSSIIQTPTDDAVTFVGDRTYTYENEYTNERIDEILRILDVYKNK